MRHLPSLFALILFGPLQAQGVFVVEDLCDRCAYNQPVTPSIRSLRGSPIQATLDGKPYTLGQPIDQEGEHRLRLETKSELGSAVHEVSFTIDFDLPKLEITSPDPEHPELFWEPRESTYTSGPRFLLEGVTDPNCTIKIYHQDIRGYEITPDQEGRFRTDFYAEPGSAVGVVATDPQGRTLSRAVSFRATYPPPEISLIEPVGPSVAQFADVVVAVASYSIHDLIGVRLLIDGKIFGLNLIEKPPEANPASYVQYYGARLEELSPGPHQIIPVVHHLIGQRETRGTPLSLEVLPLDAESLAAKAFAVEGVARGGRYNHAVTPTFHAVTGAPVQAFLNGQPFMRGSEIDTHGSYRLLLKTKSGANELATELTFELDLEKPTLLLTMPDPSAIMWEPRHLAYSNGPGIPVAGQTEPGATAMAVWADGNRRQNLRVDDTGHFSGIVYAGHRQVSLTFETTDLAGNSHQESFDLDLAAPPPGIDWEHPAESQVTSLPVQVAFAVRPYEKIEYEAGLLVDGALLPPSKTQFRHAGTSFHGPQWIYYFDLDQLTPGPHELVPVVNCLNGLAPIEGPAKHIDVGVKP